MRRAFFRKFLSPSRWKVTGEKLRNLGDAHAMPACLSMIHFTLPLLLPFILLKCTIVHAAPNKPTELYHSARQCAVLLTYRTQKSQQITTYAVYYRLLASFSTKTTDVLLLGHFFAGPGEQRRSKHYPTISRSMSWVWSLHKQTEAKHFKCLQHAIMIVIRYCRRYCTSTIIEGFHGYYKMLFTKIWTPWNSHIECIIHSLRTKLALIQLLY